MDRRNCVDPHSLLVSYRLTLFLCTSSQNFSISRISSECCARSSRVLMMHSLSYSSAVSPQMEPKCGFWFGKLSTEWWERPPLANTGKYGEKQLINDTYSASRAQCQRNNVLPRDDTNNVGFGLGCHKLGTLMFITQKELTLYRDEY